MVDPRVTLIAALDRNRLIGSRNRLPWHIPEDFAWFRQKTLDHTVIMGKNTWLSLGRPLDQRTNIVLTRTPGFSAPGAMVCRSVEECLDACGPDECFVIGGAQVFRLFLPIAAKLCLTTIDAEFDGDTWFPDYDPLDWDMVFFESRISAQNGYRLTFSEYTRKGLHSESGPA